MPFTTVKELIGLLSAYDPDLEVGIWGDYSGGGHIDVDGWEVLGDDY